MIKKCKNCGKKFECYDKAKSKSRPQGHQYKRPFRAVTCSAKCSRAWQYNPSSPKYKTARIREKLNKKNKKEKK